MQTVPIAPVPSQTLSIVLGGQQVSIALYLLGSGDARAMYMDLFANGVTVYTSRIVRAFSGLPANTPPFLTVGEHYHGFQGDLLFIDTQATPTTEVEDPMPAGLGTRWQLVYFTVAELKAAGLIA